MNNSFLKQRRIELNLTLKDVANKVGVSEGTISRWESGHIANMRRDRIYLYAKALNVSVSEIMDMPKSETPESFNKLFEALTPYQQQLVSKFMETISLLTDDEISEVIKHMEFTLYKRKE